LTEFNPEVVALQFKTLTEQNERILEKLDTYLPRETFNTWETAHSERIRRIEEAHQNFTTDTVKREGDLRTELKEDLRGVVTNLDQNAKSIRNIWLTVVLGFLSTVAAALIVGKVVGTW